MKKERTKLSIVASALQMFRLKQQHSGWNVFEQMQRVANKAKPRGKRISQPSSPSYAMMRKQNKEADAHAMRCQFRVKGNTIMADGRHRFYLKNGVFVDRVG